MKSLLKNLIVSIFGLILWILLGVYIVPVFFSDSVVETFLTSGGAVISIYIMFNLLSIFKLFFKSVALNAKGINKKMSSSELLGFLIGRYWYFILALLTLTIVLIFSL
jgi:hypothetical protein